MTRDRNVGLAASVAFAAAAAVLLANAYVADRNTRGLAGATDWVTHTVEVQQAHQALLAALSAAEAEQRAYLLTGDDRFAARFEAAKAAVGERVDAIQTLTADNDRQQVRLATTRRLIAARLDALDRNRRLGPKGWQPALLEEGNARMAALRDNLEEISGEETDLLVVRRAAADRTFRQAVQTVVVATAVALGAVAGGFALVRRDAAARRRLADAREALAAERERAAAEQERLAGYNALLLESSGEGIYGIDRDGRCTFANAAAARTLGRPAADLLGRDMHALVHHSRPDGTPFPAADCPIYRTVATGVRARVEDDAFVRADGTPVPVEYSAAPLRDGGRVVGAVVVFADVSRRKRAEAEVRAAKEAAEDASRAKSEFLASMSHELRTPLNAVIMYSELLQEEAQDIGQADKFGPDLDRIRAAGKHLLSLVNGVLDLSKIEAGKMELDLETFDLAAAVGEVVDTVRPLVGKRGNALAVDCPADLGTVHADTTKVRQILFNLLSNASKFTEGGTVTLTARRAPGPAGEVVTLAVADTGIGMTAEQVGKLFQPFTQADASTTRRYGGTGLGMTISKRFAGLMGGDIAVASEAGTGTTFTLTLPARVGAGSATPARPLPVLPATAPVMLVVDDDPGVRGLLARELADRGVRAVLAADGEEGLRLAREHRPAAVFLDVIMPRLDGWAVLAALKADPALRDTPVVMMAMAADPELGYVLGAADYLQKPIDPARLAAALARHRPAPDGRVLVVDDDPGTREVLRRALAKEGWAVDEAENGRQALDRVTAGPPALVLLDLLMPEMNGFEFVAELRRKPDWGGIPVVVLTSKDLTPDERAALNGHVERVMQKGAFSRASLVAEVSRVVAAYGGPAPGGGGAEPAGA